mmetsp:Transcript_29919/g.95435  ORF Transcript_29919/g.95435 Transcript_29919/m.95435 type:complete len:219 (-) Transcript_29919:208-864(-)
MLVSRALSGSVATSGVAFSSHEQSKVASCSRDPEPQGTRADGCSACSSPEVVQGCGGCSTRTCDGGTVPFGGSGTVHPSVTFLIQSSRYHPAARVWYLRRQSRVTLFTSKNSRSRRFPPWSKICNCWSVQGSIMQLRTRVKGNSFLWYLLQTMQRKVPNDVLAQSTLSGEPQSTQKRLAGSRTLISSNRAATTSSGSDGSTAQRFFFGCPACTLSRSV